MKNALKIWLAAQVEANLYKFFFAIFVFSPFRLFRGSDKRELIFRHKSDTKNVFMFIKS